MLLLLLLSLFLIEEVLNEYQLVFNVFSKHLPFIGKVTLGI